MCLLPMSTLLHWEDDITWVQVVGIGKTCKVYKGNGEKDNKNICYLKGYSMRKMLKDSKVKMKSKNIEVFGTLAQGRVHFVCV